MNGFQKLKKLYYKVFHPITLGSRCMVIAGNTVLLVKHSYAKGWYLPGGGVEKGESFRDAAKREVCEETGLDVDALKLFHLYYSRIEGKNDHIALFTTTHFSGKPHITGNEITEILFAPFDKLPADTSPATRRRIAEYLGETRADTW